MTFQYLNSILKEQFIYEFNENIIQELMQKSESITLFLEKGFFYDHKKNTSGLIYEKNGLEKFVNKLNIDPASSEEHQFQKIDENIFKNNLDKIDVYELQIPHGTNNIIKDNYKLYLVLEK